MLLMHIAGAVLILGLIVMHKLRLWRFAANAKPAEDPALLEMYDRLCRTIQPVRRPSVLLSGKNHAPMTFGTWRPVVVLPQDLVARLSPSGIRVILGHELAHHRRWDLWLGLLQIPITALWWFHPVYWLLARGIRNVREDCCDDLVVSSGLASGEEYCRTLMQAAWLASENALAGASPAYISESQPLRRRFKRIMGAQFIARPKLAATGMLGTVALGLLLLPGVESRTFQVSPASTGVREIELMTAPLRTELSGDDILLNSELPVAVTAEKASFSAMPGKPSSHQENSLAEYYRKWLNEDVVYIITREERNVFLALTTDGEREAFIEQSWARRDPDPQKEGNAFKVEHYRRMAYANEYFASDVPGWKTDRGRIYILYGEPAGKEAHPTGGGYYRQLWEGGGSGSNAPFERWSYYSIGGIQDAVSFEFVDRTANNAYTLVGAQLPYAIRTDFIYLSEDRVLVPITLEIENRTLLFRKESNLYQARVLVSGIVARPTGNLISEFENTISADYSDSSFPEGKNQRSLFQKILLLQAGMQYRLSLTLKDLNGSDFSSSDYGILVPKFNDREFQASSLILATQVVSASADASYRMNGFIIGDMKVVPNVRIEYVNGQHLIPYLQIYNASIDPASSQPSLQISYAVKSGDIVVYSVEDPAGKTVRSASERRAVIVGSVPVHNVAAGIYSLAITVTDRIAGKSLTTTAEFRVTNAR